MMTATWTCLFFLLMTSVVAARRNNPCFIQEEVMKAVRDCRNSTRATDNRPSTVGPTNAEDDDVTTPAEESGDRESREVEDDNEIGNGNPGRRPGGRPFGRPGWHIRSRCFENVLSGIQNSSIDLDFDSIKNNLGKVASSDKLPDLQAAMEKCKASYETEEEQAKDLRQKNRDYVRCFQTELRGFCRRSRRTTSTAQPDIGRNPEPETAVDDCLPGNGIVCAME